LLERYAAALSQACDRQNPLEIDIDAITAGTDEPGAHASDRSTGAQAAIVPGTVLAVPRHPPSVRPRGPRPSRGPGERLRMGEILSYLAAAMPANVSAGARLLALQCALRMNANMHVELAAGLLRGLRFDAGEICAELERARWLSMANGPGAAGVFAELLDARLLAQSPGRPDR
jgi:hypothetical protein